MKDGNVVAYSGIGNGATFSVDISKGKVTILSVEDDGVIEAMDDVPAESEEEGGEDDTIDMENQEIQFTEEEEDVDELLEPFYLAEANNSPTDGSSNKKRFLQSTNGNPAYNCQTKLTFVKVDKVMRPATIGAKNQRKTGCGGADDSRDSSPATNNKNLTTVVARGIQSILHETFDGQTRIHQASDAKHPAYKMAHKFLVPEKVIRSQSWARRPRQGEYYGKKFIGPHKDLLRKLFDAGKEEDSCKMSSDQMLEALVKAYPGVYCLPSSSEIDSFISQCFQGDKNAQGIEEEEEEATPPSVQNKQNEIIAERHSEEIKSVLNKYDGKIMPRFINNRLAFVFQNEPEFNFQGQTKDSSIPPPVRDLVTKMRANFIKQRKRRFIG